MTPNDEDKAFDDNFPVIKGYPLPDESKVEDLPIEWLEEDRIIEGRLPDLGELDEDPSEI